MVERSGPWRLALSNALRDGLFVMDPTGAVVEINHAFTEILGFGPEGLPYRQPCPWWPDPVTDPAAHEQMVAATAESEAGGLARWEVPARHLDGRRVWVEVFLDPVHDPDDPGVAVVGVLRDVTVEHRARTRERVLAELGRLLAGCGALDERLAGFTRSLAAATGDLVVLTRAQPDGSLRVTHAAHPERPELAEWALGLPPRRIPELEDGAPLRAGDAVVVDRVSTALLDRFVEVRSGSPPGLFAGAVAPIQVGGRLLGAVGVIRSRPDRGFDDSDVRFGEELARRLAGAIEADRVAGSERRLHEATAALAGAVTMTQAAAVLAGVIAEAMGGAVTCVYAPDPDDPAKLRMLHSDGLSPDLAARYRVVSLRGSSPVADAARGDAGGGAGVWLKDPRAWRERYPDLAPAAAAHGTPALAALPLLHAGRVLGVLSVGFDTTRAFPDTERDLASTLVTQAAQAFERAALTDARWRIAQTLQSALLPAELPTVPGIELAAHYQPAGLHSQAGGDWYDVIRLDSDRAAIVMGDVVGAGASAAAIMGQLRGAVAALLLDSESCSETLRQLSRVAARISGATLSTALILILNSVTGELSWARAGHPPPLLLDPHDPERPARYLIDAEGPSLGVLESLGAGHPASGAMGYREARRVLHTGASLVLFTDGLVERRGCLIDDGLDRLRGALDYHAGAGVGELLTITKSAVGDGGRPHDDVAIVIAQLTPLTPDPRIPAALRLTLPARPEQLRPLRRAFSEWAAQARLSADLTGDLQLAIGEAAANAIDHAYPPGRPGEFECVVEYTGDRRVRVEVRDHGSWRTPPTNTGFRGRGLHLVRTIADDVTLQAGATGTTIIFTVAVVPADVR